MLRIKSHLSSASSLLLSKMQTVPWFAFWFFSRYISRYASLKFGFSPFVVASIVAMIFLRRICSARRARFPTCGVVRVSGYSVVWECISTSEFFPKAPKGALRPFLGRSAPSLLLFSWCASDYSVVGRIICYNSHDNVRTNVCQRPFAENFLLLTPLLNRIDSISNLRTFSRRGKNLLAYEEVALPSTL